MTLKIGGMSCQHCRDSVTKALREVPGVEQVDVNLEGGYAQVTAPESLRAQLIAAVEDIGFDAE